jgi:uncharacterized membrane protein YqgA involved in biofilm formation
MHASLVKMIGIFTVALGVKMFAGSKEMVCVVLSLVIGGVLGEWMNVERIFEKTGERIKKIVRSNDSNFLDGFVTASLVYCVGPMAIMGGIADGVSGARDILFTKSIMDGTISVAFATTLGLGVLFSFFPVLIYQGGITLVAIFAGRFLTAPMVNELTAVGGVLLMGIGFNVAGFYKEKRLPVANFLPALVVVLFLVWGYAKF